MKNDHLNLGSADNLFSQLFEQQAARVPDALAIRFGEQSLTYRELNSRANQLAHHLQASGVGPETLVALCVEPSVEMAVGIIGILKAGGAYLPIDPVYPQDRITYLLEDAQAKLLLTQKSLLSLRSDQTPILCLDSEWDMIARQSDENPQNTATKEDLAYVIYTSGSTGRPKGTLIQHGGMMNYLHWAAQAYDVEAGEGVPLHSSIAFDLTVTAFFPPLMTGKQVVIVPQSAGVDSLVQVLKRQQQFSYIKLTPAHLKLLSQQIKPTEAAHLFKKIIVGGEALHTDDVAFWRVHAPETVIYNEYGPTETVVGTVLYQITEETGPGPVLIGRPIANARIYVLDEQCQPVAVGTVGEIYIGGPGVARGYLNRPDLTAERFLLDPFANEPGARMYKTGDLARYQADGNLEYLGRIDDQVKIRGYRIELGEVEQTLLQHPAVYEAVVTVREDTPGDVRLVAYLRPQAGLSLTPLELRSFLQKGLPEYMVPAAFVVLDRFPLTANGKVDRRALPAPVLQRHELSSEYVAPRNELEQAMVEIWSRILGVETLGIEDNFFELGGHSLLATQILTRMREQLEVEISFVHFFEAPTIATLAEVVRQIQNGDRVSTLQTIRPYPRHDRIPPSFAQERVWFVQQLNPDSMSYNVQSIIRFFGPLDHKIWEQSLNEIVKRHEIFRTTFPTVEARPVMRVHDHEYTHYPLIDLRHLPLEQREPEAQRLLAEELAKPFDLAKLPLIRWTLLQLADEEFLMLHVETHLLHDGWSMNTFLGELMEMYSSIAAGRSSAMPELPIQFADFAQWQHEWLQSEEATQQLAYWQQKLADAPQTLDLPTDHLRPPVQSHKGGVLRVELPHELAEGLRTLTRTEGMTLFITMFSAFRSLLYRYTGQRDMLIGSGIANRRTKESERLIGMIVNNIVLRTIADDEMTFRELLAQARQMAMEAYANQDFPFDKVVEALQPERDLSRNPLIQVMFSFHDSPINELQMPGIEVQLTEALGNGAAKFDLNVIVIPRTEQRIGRSMKEKPKGITMIFEYSTDLFEASTMVRLFEQYKTLLAAVIKQPELRLRDLPILTDAERQQVLVEWNETQAGNPHRSIKELFEAQVAQAPDRVALVFGDKTMTYGELNTRANQVAHELLQQGVTGQGRVGIAVERSFEMIVGIFGILKTGAAYVPLDPSYPHDRLLYMMEDTGLRLLLTQQHLVDKLPLHSAKTICLDADWAQIALQKGENPQLHVDAEQLAYVMYTSGSTGQPKGVCVPQRGVVRLVTESNSIHLSADEVMVQFATISFDPSVLEIFGALLNGARLVVFPPHRPSLEEFGRLLRQHQVTTLWLTTGLFHEMVDADVQAFAGIKQLIAGGEVVSPVHVKKVLQQLQGIHVFNGYGPTECTTFATVYRVTDADEIGTHVPIGRPIQNTQLYVLDAHRQPVPIGVPGELYIGGEGLALGYLNQPELTNERFVPNPFTEQANARLYKTGDLVRWQADGNLEFLGRIDDQVKIRGFRIELGEIETVIGQHPAVLNQKVIVHRQNGSQHLVAYVVLQDGHGVQEPRTELRAYLKKRMPGYMVPAVVMVVDSLPLNANGKVDQRALPTPDFASVERVAAFVEPRTETERQMVQIWREVLQVEHIGVQDHFFDLGGHSLMATRVISRVNQLFGTDLSLAAIFEHSTVEELVQVVEERQATAKDEVAASLSPISRVDVQATLENLDEMSPEELEALFQSMMDEEGAE